MTLKEKFIKDSSVDVFSKVVLAIRMPDGSKEIIINDNVQNKIDYVIGKYDDNLKMNNAPICIEEYLFVK